MCFIGVAKNDALAKARGEPTQGFHNIQPNYSNPEIMAAVADKKAGRSTKFYDTGVPNIWQQYSTKESTPPRQATSGGSTGLSIQSRPSVRTGSGTRVAARERSTARQSRTKRFTTR